MVGDTNDYVKLLALVKKKVSITDRRPVSSPHKYTESPRGPTVTVYCRLRQ